MCPCHAWEWLGSFGVGFGELFWAPFRAAGEMLLGDRVAQPLVVNDAYNYLASSGLSKSYWLTLLNLLFLTAFLFFERGLPEF